MHNHQPVGNFDGVFQKAYRGQLSHRSSTSSAAIHPEDVAAHLRLSDGMARPPTSPSTSTGWPIGRRRADRNPRRGLLRADPGDDPLLRPRRADPQLYPLPARPPRRQGSRHVDAGAGLGTNFARDGRRGHRIHDPRRLPLQVCRPARRAAARHSSPRTKAGSSRSSPAASGSAT